MSTSKNPGQAGRDVPASDAVYAELFAVNPVPAVVSRLEDDVLVAVNARAADVFGVPQQAAVGCRVTDFYVNPGDRERLVAQLRREGRADSLRLLIRRPDGETFWGLESARLVTWAGAPAVFAVFTDINDQMAAEARLSASERRLGAQNSALTGLMARYGEPGERLDERLRSVLTMAAETLLVERVSVWSFDPTRQTLRCRSQYERSTGRCESGAVLNRSHTPTYFAALDRDRVIAAGDAREDPRTREFLASYLAPHDIGAMLDVPLRHNNTSVGVVCAEHVGDSRPWTVDEQQFAIAVANLVAVALADDERRQALDRLAESETRSRVIVDTAHDAFIGMGSDGRIATWNAQAEQTFGWTRDEAIGRDLAETIIPIAFREAHNRGMERFHRTGAAPVVNKRLELTALHKSGREFPIEITVTSPTRVEGGWVFGAFLRDISDRHERDAQLRLAKESAEAATRAKSEFLANMSHELRTPLNGVLGYAQILLRDRSLNTSQREALKAISRGGSHLLDLINDVLDLSKIEAGRIDLEPVATDLARLAVDLRYIVAEPIRLKGLLLTIALAPGTPRRVVLDGRHLRQVLLNLLGNAVKFTDRGEIRLAIGASDEQLTFEVSDTGIGIEPGALDAIFESFTQTDSGAAAGGTGLGLTISRRLVASMGGDLKVASTLGQGSRFFFTLPLVLLPDGSRAAVAQDELSAPPLYARLAEGQDVLALVADDNTANRRILAGLLESAGVHVISATGGLEAVTLTAEHRPDIVFMDLRMPDLDGLAATRQLAASPATAGIPVVAVTASAFGDTRTAARDAGCVDYLPKPVRAETLFAILQTQLGVQFVTGQPPEALDDSGPIQVPRHLMVATRIREAAALGDITDLDQLAQQLMAGDAGEGALARRIAQLAASFDFEGLRALADSLSAAGDGAP